MGRKSRDKGLRVEREIVNAMQASGFAAERIPLSGSAGGSFAGDITMPLLGTDQRYEVKCRADGFAQLYGWLAEHDGLIVKADRKQPLMVMPLDRFLALCRVAEGAKALTALAGVNSGGRGDCLDNRVVPANSQALASSDVYEGGVSAHQPEEI